MVVDPTMDIFGDEPHLLRLIDMLLDDDALAIKASPTAISEYLGLSVSASWEMLKRLEERSLIRDGYLRVEDVLYRGRGWQRMFTLGIRMQRERAVRVAALGGQWMARRFRVAQTAVVRKVGRWWCIHWDAVHAVEREQVRRAESGEDPWLDRDELEALARSYAGVPIDMRGIVTV